MPQQQLQQYCERIEVQLDARLPAATILPSRLHQAMRYAVLGGGKRLRPALVYATGQLLGAPLEHLDEAACAVELIHAYSLVHDDLPAMDDDDYRRGQPSCHRAFDEAMAILVGDALQALAFQVLAKESLQGAASMVLELARASGSRGMVGGQAIDLAAVGRHIDLAELQTMHIHKTGALIRASIALGALAAGLERDDSRFQRLDHYGKCIGLAFQIRDDILDETGDFQHMGKRAGADRDEGKPNYVSLLGLAGARDSAQQLCHDGLDCLHGLESQDGFLSWLAQYIIDRTH